jgi:hypothetical protein
VHLSRERVGEVVEHEGGLVREDPVLLRPEPERGKVFMLAGGEVNDAIHAATRSRDPPVLQV